MFGSFPVGSSGLLGIFCLACSKHRRRGCGVRGGKVQARFRRIAWPAGEREPMADEARTFC